MRKILTFGLMGALGCLAGAIVGEVFLWFATPAPPPAHQVDVCFVLDVTASMQPQIDGVREGIASFARELSRQSLDSRFGLVAFRDRFRGEEPEILSFQDGTFTHNPDQFRQQVRKLRAEGGGDAPESTLDALVTASEQPFRSHATRVLVLITDAPPKVPDKSTPSVSAAEEALRQARIDQLHLVIDRLDQKIYAPLQEAAPGEVFTLDSISGGVSNFDSLLPIVGKQIADRTIRGFQTTSGLGTSIVRSIAIACVWSVLVAVGISLALICGQNHYLHRPAWNPRDATIGTMGAVVAGLIAGGSAQLLYLPLSASGISALDFLARVVGWAVLGCLVGRGMAYFVPNLAPRPALIGGGVGGALAAIAFVIVTSLMGATLGRWLGVVILGFCIGAMVALIEYAIRSAWLEVRYGQKEVIHVSLGTTPVKIGSNTRACTVFAREARPIALEYKLTDGQVFCTDYSTEMTSPVDPGSEKQLGDVLITVRASAQAPASAGIVHAPIVPPPPPGAPRAAAPLAPPVAASAPPVAPAAATPVQAAPLPVRTGVLPAPPPPPVPRTPAPAPVTATPAPAASAPVATAPKPATPPASAPAARAGVIPPPPPPPLPKKP